MNRHLRGGLLITAAMLIFSGIGPFVRFIALPPPVILLVTSLTTAMLLLAWFSARSGLGALRLTGYRWWMFFSAVFVFGNVFCFYKAYALTTMANAILTHYTAPVFAALLAPAVLGERLERVTVVSLLISMTGLFLIASGDIALSGSHLAGIGWGTCSGLFYGISILVGKRVVQHYEPLVVLLYQCAIMACLALPLALLGPFELTPDRLPYLLAYSLVVCLLGVCLYLRGLRHVEAQHAGILAYSEPLFVVLLGIVLGEIPTIRIVAGGLLIVLSGGLILRAESRRI